MFNFKDLIDDILLEQGKTYKELEDAGVICRRTFYLYKSFTPYLETVLKIANYLKVSLDYIVGRSTVNNFREYKIPPSNFYDKMIKVLATYNVTQSKLANDLEIGRSNFTYWKQGKQPKLETLVLIADYFKFSIDELLEHEN